MLTLEAIRQILGPVDTSLAVEVNKAGATADELRQARMWLENDDALVNDLQPFPNGTVARLIDILRAADLIGEDDR